MADSKRPVKPRSKRRRGTAALSGTSQSAFAGSSMSASILAGAGEEPVEPRPEDKLSADGTTPDATTKDAPADDAGDKSAGDAESARRPEE